MHRVRPHVKLLLLAVWISLWLPAVTAEAAFHLEYEDPTDHPTFTTRFVPATRIASVRIETKRTYEQHQARQAARNAIPASIIECESGGISNPAASYKAENPNSTASGRYQFIDSTFQGMDGVKGGGYHASDGNVYYHASHAPPHIQDEAAVKLWDGGKGRGHWEC